jgi:molybdate transport system regulatory protein
MREANTEETLEQIARERARAGAGELHVPGDVRHLDDGQLATLEAAFRAWAEKPRRADVRASRARIVLLFLVLRYTGARLGETLALSMDDFAPGCESVRLGTGDGAREVGLPGFVAEELSRARETGALSDAALAGAAPFAFDPGHLRRKFYERAEEAGLPRELCNPTVLRRSRGIELLRRNLPLQMVQRVLGHSTPSLAAGYVEIADEDVERAMRFALGRERRRTSARNAFFGRIASVTPGDIQAEVRLDCLGGHAITCMVTNGSVKRMGLVPEKFVTAEVKAPWVMLATGDDPPDTSAPNRLHGTVRRITQGRFTSEIMVRLADDTDVCAVITEDSRAALNLSTGDPAWVFFTENAVILNLG